MPQLGSTKSRKGCKRCKQRRVKCDEQVPCGSCVRRDEHCSFLDAARIGGSETPAEPLREPFSEEWILDLELMHHYTTVLSALGARDQVVNVWRHYIPQQAFKHHFLMHGLLAFAALHLAYLNPDSAVRYLRVCDKHQGIAVQEFRALLSSPTDTERADALFALSATLSLSSMGRSCALSDTETMDMDAVAELFVLTKGVANVLNLSHHHISQGPLKEMLVLSSYPEGTTINLPIRVSSRFEAIRQMLVTCGLDSDALEDCQHALTALEEETYKNIMYFSTRSNIHTGMVSSWQVRVSMGYVRLVQRRSSPALVILAYYAAAITAIHNAWYTENWAEYTLRAISQSLEEDSQQWIQWPMLQLQEKMSDLGVQPLAERTKDLNLS